MTVEVEGVIRASHIQAIDFVLRAAHEGRDERANGTGVTWGLKAASGPIAGGIFRVGSDAIVPTCACNSRPQAIVDKVPHPHHTHQPHTCG